MFQHSVRVPRLYKIAAKIAKEVTEGAGSVKQLVYENQKKHPNIKAIFALVTTLFQRSDEIESLLKRSNFLTKESRSDPWLTKILMVELLWGRQRLPGVSKPEKTILAYEQIFKAHLSDVSLTPKTVDSKEETKPRYVRVNTLSISLNEAVDCFRDEGWTLCNVPDKMDYKEFLGKVKTLGEDEFLVDIHIPDLLIFPPKTHFYNHPAYKNGSIILQDKASCLPVHILNPPPGSTVLDMCAAPGMKTTQVAAAIKDEGTVFAVERDPRRFETLNNIVESSGAKCIQTVNKDVLTCNAKEFPGVQYILVDPSCSGSGITDRLEAGQSQAKDQQQRMNRLAGFQIKILRNALTRYPDVKRVVYSTCSVYPEENEDVVRQVLETNSIFKLVPAKQFVNDAWQNFGSSDFGDIGKYCLYAKPNEDLTNGFFVAVFEKLEEGEANQFFNTKVYNYKKHVDSQEKRRQRKQNEHYPDNDKVDCQMSGDTNEQDYHQTESYEDNPTTKHENTSPLEISGLIEDQILHGGGSSQKKRKKQKKQRLNADEEPDNEAENNDTTIKKRKSKLRPAVTDDANGIEAFPNDVQEQQGGDEVKHKKKKKKNKNKESATETVEADVEVPINKKKKSTKEVAEFCFEETDNIGKKKTKTSKKIVFEKVSDHETGISKKKKKHKHNTETSDDCSHVEPTRKKKRKVDLEEDLEVQTFDDKNEIDSQGLKPYVRIKQKKNKKKLDQS